jgi:hypothetical protein
VLGPRAVSRLSALRATDAQAASLVV